MPNYGKTNKIWGASKSKFGSMTKYRMASEIFPHAALQYVRSKVPFGNFANMLFDLEKSLKRIDINKTDWRYPAMKWVYKAYFNIKKRVKNDKDLKKKYYKYFD